MEWSSGTRRADGIPQQPARASGAMPVRQRGFGLTVLGLCTAMTPSAKLAAALVLAASAPGRFQRVDERVAKHLKVFVSRDIQDDAVARYP